MTVIFYNIRSMVKISQGSKDKFSVYRKTVFWIRNVTQM